MQQPRGFEAPGEEDKVFHLKRAIYGLRQLGREWYEDLMGILTTIGFKRCRVEHAVFYRFDQDATMLAMDVDDITITRNSCRAVQRFKDQLSLHYGIKDMGNLRWLLGIGIDRDCKNCTISFSQAPYLQKMVEHFGMDDANPLSIPITPGHNLSKSQSPANDLDIEEMRDIPYWEAVGSLMYVVVGTRPDIAYAVSYLARFMSNPGRVYWEAVKRVIRYLKGTKDTKLILRRGGTLTWEEANRQSRLGVKGYSDANGNSQEHRHAISSYAFCIDRGAVSWNLRKQAIISLSTTESEYIAMTHTTKEAIQMCMFLGEVLHPLSKLMLLYCDNQLAIAVAKDNQFHTHMKHINIRYHFICEAITQNIIEVRYFPTQHMVADIFTK